jgi:predicted nicotinamide N-methyase
MSAERIAEPRAHDATAFIAKNLRLAPVPCVPEIRLYTAHPASGLRRLVAGRNAAAPYWAYPWAGGIALARFLLDRPEIVAGLRVLDLGAGSGLVGIAAAKAGAAEVIAVETDRNGLAAIALNAAANSVAVHALGEDVTGGEPPEVQIVLAGDIFYDAALALRVETFLDRCLGRGIAVLVGDPGRAPLPRARLRLLAEFAVPDFGDGRHAATGKSAVFVFEPRPAV